VGFAKLEYSTAACGRDHYTARITNSARIRRKDNFTLTNLTVPWKTILGTVCGENMNIIQPMDGGMIIG
jgi:hypothetical protein